MLVKRTQFLYPCLVMDIFLIVFAALGAVILVIHVTLTAGVARNLRHERRMSTPRRPAPRAEVVIALRDEESDLPRLLESLAAQTVKETLFLLVDDRSRDSTPALLDAFCAHLPDRARVIHNRVEPTGLTGKQAALELAFGQARGDILFFTDGDCRLEPTWIEEMLKHFDDPKVGAVLGRVELPEGDTFLARFQAFEQPLLNQYNFGSVGIGMPTGCFGNNMAIRRQAVLDVGGFGTLGYSVTEDALLMDAVSRKAGWRVRACVSPRAANITSSKTSWREYVNQHTRWNAGGLFSPDIVTRLSYVFIVLIYLVGSLLVALLGFLDWRVPVLSLNSFLSIGLLAFASGLYPGKRRGLYYARFLPYLFFFGFFYSFVTLRAVLGHPFEWKGSNLRP
jgi:poly-beta-1,6-N-acetyl-D-glucosamine synthase